MLIKEKRLEKKSNLHFPSRHNLYTLNSKTFQQKIMQKENLICENLIFSVLPCSASYDALTDNSNENEMR
jgi:hypothetical protein